MSDSIRLVPFGPIITAEMRAIRNDEVVALSEPTDLTLDVQISSGICHCGEDANHSGWDGHSPVEMMETVQVSARAMGKIIDAMRAELDRHQKIHPRWTCDVCEAFRKALSGVEIRS